MEMETHKMDRRVIRTRKNIRQAFTTLIMEKEYSKITVSDIAQHAGINRRTFYLHYASVDEVLQEVERDLVDRVRTFQDYVDLLNPELDCSMMFFRLSAVLNENATFLERILQTEAYHIFFNRLKMLWRDALTARYTPELRMSREEFALQAEFFTAGILSMYACWISDRSKISLEELGRTAIRMTNAWREEVLSGKKAEFRLFGANG